MNQDLEKTLWAAADKLRASHKYPPDRQEEATETVLRQAESLSADWALA